jgi:DNA polymerase III subunit beta
MGKQSLTSQDNNGGPLTTARQPPPPEETTMQLLIGKTALAKALTSIGRIIESRNTMPILSHFRLEATATSLQITGTDLDIEATTFVETDIITQGAICVDAKLLSDIVKKSSGDISLAVEGDQLTVKSGRSRFKLATLPVADFPALLDAKYDAEFELDLAALVKPVRFAISNEETRYYLNGVYFVSADNGSVAVATDGHRLSRHRGPALPAFEGVIIPKKTVGLLPQGVCQVSVSANRIRIAGDGVVMVSKLIDGTFPDYERVIPTGNENMVTVDRDEMMRAADRVASISSEKGRGVKLSVSSGAVALAAHSDVGSAEDEVAAEYGGAPIDIGFNSRYLADALTAFAAGPVTLALNDSMSPGLLTGANAGLDIVLMPMRVS